MPNYAPRVSLPYNDVSGVVRVWASKCDKMAVYEHGPDECKCNRPHIHAILINCIYKTEAQLKNLFYKEIDTEMKGNDLWAWEHKDYPNPDESYISYMSKGKFDPVFVKEFDAPTIDFYKSQGYDKKDKLIVRKQVEPHDVIPAVEKPKQLTKWELLNIMKHELELFKQRHPGWIITKTHRNRIVAMVLKEEKQVIGLYKAIDFSYALQLHGETEEFVDAMDAAMKY